MKEDECISVKDRLPEHLDKVLIVFEDSDNILMAGFHVRLNGEKEWCPYFADGRHVTDRIVSKWMPLPNPPKQ